MFIGVTTRACQVGSTMVNVRWPFITYASSGKIFYLHSKIFRNVGGIMKHETNVGVEEILVNDTIYITINMKSEKPFVLFSKKVEDGERNLEMYSEKVVNFL